MNSSKMMSIYTPNETGALVFSLDETGTIVSSFDKAVNIRVSDRRLVSIVRHETAMAPMGIHCPALLDSNEIRLRIGQTVTFADGILAADGWRMDTRGVKPYEGHLAVQKVMGADEQKLDLFERILHFAGQKDGLLGITRDADPRNHFARKGRQIVEKIMSNDGTHVTDHLAEFIGLGPGFTPAGDDLISGFLMGETLAKHELRLFPEDMLFAQGPITDGHPRSILWNAAKGTCDAGRTLIWMALKGRFPRFLCRAATALSHAETSKDILAMVTDATRYGHTSGTDALTGLLLYFKTCRRYGHHSRPRINAPSDLRPIRHLFYATIG